MTSQIHLSKALPVDFRRQFEERIQTLEKWPLLKPRIHLRRWDERNYTLSYASSSSPIYFSVNAEVEADQAAILHCLSRKIEEEIDSLKVKASLRSSNLKSIKEKGYPRWAWLIPDPMGKAIDLDIPAGISTIISDMLAKYPTQVGTLIIHKVKDTSQRLNLLWDQRALRRNLEKVESSEWLPIPRMEFALSDEAWKIYCGKSTNTVHLHRQKFPQSILMSCRDKPIGAYVEHPLIDPDMIVCGMRQTTARVMVDYHVLRRFLAPAPIQDPREIDDIMRRDA